MIKFSKEYVLQLIENSCAAIDINYDDFNVLYIDKEDEAGRIVFYVPDGDNLYLYIDCMEDEIEYDEGTNTFMLKCFRPDIGLEYWLAAQLLVDNRPNLSKALSV